MKYDKAKSVGIIIGIVISIFLIGQQTGIFIFLTNAMKALVTKTSLLARRSSATMLRRS